MIISTSSHNILLTRDLDEFVARTMRDSLERLSEHVMSMDVFIKDVNGPKGGIDKQVVVRIHVRNRGQLVVHGVAAGLQAAIRQGAKRAKRALRRSLRKSRRIEKLRVVERLDDPGRLSEVGV